MKHAMWNWRKIKQRVYRIEIYLNAWWLCNEPDWCRDFLYCWPYIGSFHWLWLDTQNFLSVIASSIHLVRTDESNGNKITWIASFSTSTNKIKPFCRRLYQSCNARPWQVLWCYLSEWTQTASGVVTASCSSCIVLHNILMVLVEMYVTLVAYIAKVVVLYQALMSIR